jgi:hypothetical protein
VRVTGSSPVQNPLVGRWFTGRPHRRTDVARTSVKMSAATAAGGATPALDTAPGLSRQP